MSAMFDLMLSLFVGSAIMGIIVTATLNYSEEAASQSHDVQVMEVLLSTVEVIEYDLRNIGAGVADTLQKVSLATLSSITFREVLNRASLKVDTIAYYLGPTSEILKSENPNDRYLYRRVNLRQPERVGIITEFTLQYSTAGGGILPVPVPADRLSEINAIEVTMEVQSQRSLTDESGVGGPKRYPSARIVARRFETRNLKR